METMVARGRDNLLMEIEQTYKEIKHRVSSQASLLGLRVEGPSLTAGAA